MQQKDVKGNPFEYYAPCESQSRSPARAWICQAALTAIFSTNLPLSSPTMYFWTNATENCLDCAAHWLLQDIQIARFRLIKRGSLFTGGRLFAISKAFSISSTKITLVYISNVEHHLLQIPDFHSRSTFPDVVEHVRWARYALFYIWDRACITDTSNKAPWKLSAETRRQNF